MSGEENKKHWIAHAPSILTGLAALTAALTTVYVNVRNNDKPVAATAPQVSAVDEPAAVKAIPAKPSSKTLDLQLDRIRVDNDGTMGTTDWTFDIKNGERSLFSVPFKSLTDKAGENIVAPEKNVISHAGLTTVSGSSPEINVSGWKQAWSGKAQAPDVIGHAKLNPDDDSIVIEAKSEKAGGPSFVL